MAIIKHGDYYTVYSKMENVTISKGDKVKNGQEIGILGGNGEFHFEVWKNKTVLDPENWLNN
ncbi:MAG: M23 family metallopeptidase [Saprospiraceae bacterium]